MAVPVYPKNLVAFTAVFSVIYAALINPYPFVAADRIVRLTMESSAGQADWINLDGPQVLSVTTTYSAGAIWSWSAIDGAFHSDYPHRVYLAFPSRYE